MSETKTKKDSTVLKINPKIYPLEVIYSASYVFLDRAYILLDGNPESEILITLKPKAVEDLDKLSGEFLNELINYADYRERAEQTKKIRETILQRALITNDPSVLQDNKEFDEIMKELEEGEDSDYFEDPEGIATPWEEKYGDKAEKNENKIK